MTMTQRVDQFESSDSSERILQNHGELAAPVNVHRLASKLNLDVLFEDLDDDISGFLLAEGKKPCVVINKSHHPNRQRFSIAHEVAHFILHVPKGKKLFIDRLVFYRNTASTSGENRQEIEANNFAATLLMPESLLRRELEKYSDELGEDDVFRLANTFCVSSEAMTYRLGKLSWNKS